MEGAAGSMPGFLGTGKTLSANGLGINILYVSDSARYVLYPILLLSSMRLRRVRSIIGLKNRSGNAPCSRLGCCESRRVCLAENSRPISGSGTNWCCFCTPV